MQLLLPTAPESNKNEKRDNKVNEKGWPHFAGLVRVPTCDRLIFE